MNYLIRFLLMSMGFSLLVVGISLFLNGNSIGSIVMIVVGFLLFSIMLKWQELKRGFTWKDLRKEGESYFIFRGKP